MRHRADFRFWQGIRFKHQKPGVGVRGYDSVAARKQEPDRGLQQRTYFGRVGSYTRLRETFIKYSPAHGKGIPGPISY